MRSLRLAAGVALFLLPAASAADPCDNSGTLTGIVKWDGPPIRRKSIAPMKGNAFCMAQNKGKPPLEEKYRLGNASH